MGDITRPLNILTLSTLFPSGIAPNFGIFVERQTIELASRVEADVTVVNPVGIPPWPLRRLPQYRITTTLPAHEIRHGLDVYRPDFMLIPKFGAAKNPARIAKALLPLVRDLHAQRPFDVIDAEFFYPDGPAAMRIADALGIPFSIKARGSDIHYWSQQKGCHAQIMEAADKAAGLLAVSAAMKADMARLGIAANKIMVHYTGLDQERFKPVDRLAAKKNLAVDGPLFITTGALIKRKNQALVIEAMREFPHATLMLAGSGEEEGAYRALAKKLGVAQRVRFLGNVPHNELPALVAASDIAILASQSEGLANAWVEALSCGTPVIISEAGGARELVKDDIAGRIVEQSASAISAAAKEILAKPPAQEDVRAAVRHFSWHNNGDQLLDFFTKISGR